MSAVLLSSKCVLYNISKVLTMTFSPLPLMVKKAMYGCMHVFLYDAQKKSSKLFTICQKLWIYTYNKNLEAVKCIIERQCTKNWNNVEKCVIKEINSSPVIWHIYVTLFYSHIFVFTLNKISSWCVFYQCMHYNPLPPGNIIWCLSLQWMTFLFKGSDERRDLLA